MSDGVIESYIAGVNSPEILAVLGVMVIVAVWVVPMVKELTKTKLENDYDLKLKRIEIEQERERRKAEESARHDANERERLRSIGVQNQILTGLQATMETVAGQQALNNAALDDSKERSRELGRTVSDTNAKVTEIHNVLMRKMPEGTD